MNEAYRFRNAPEPTAEQKHDELLAAGWKYEHPFYISPNGKIRSRWVHGAYGLMKKGYGVD